MLASTEFLWRLNHEYVSRLANARRCLDLLEQLIYERSGQSQERLLAALQFTRSHLENLNEEHRDWRYTYFYESSETKRMVQTPRAVRRAVMSFGSMQGRHKDDLNALAAQLDVLPRPDSDITSIPTGDLWERMQIALSELVDFSNDLQPLDM